MSKQLHAYDVNTPNTLPAAASMHRHAIYQNAHQSTPFTFPKFLEPPRLHAYNSFVSKEPTATDPYAPPQSENHFIHPSDSTTEAFRDGDDFLVPGDYTAPKVCFATGKPVEDEADPSKVDLGLPFFTKYKWLANLQQPLRGLPLLAMVAVPRLTSIDWLFFPLGLLWLYLFVSHYFYSKKLNLFYASEFFQNWKARCGNRCLITLPLFAGAIYLLGTAETINHKTAACFLLLVAMAFTHLLYRKLHLHKVTGMQGSLFRVKGAHPDFLAQFPEYPKS